MATEVADIIRSRRLSDDNSTHHHHRRRRRQHESTCPRRAALLKDVAVEGGHQTEFMGRCAEHHEMQNNNKLATRKLSSLSQDNNDNSSTCGDDWAEAASLLRRVTTRFSQRWRRQISSSPFPPSSSPSSPSSTTESAAASGVTGGSMVPISAQRADAVFKNSSSPKTMRPSELRLFRVLVVGIFSVLLGLVFTGSSTMPLRVILAPMMLEGFLPADVNFTNDDADSRRVTSSSTLARRRQTFLLMADGAAVDESPKPSVVAFISNSSDDLEDHLGQEQDVGDVLVDDETSVRGGVSRSADFEQQSSSQRRHLLSSMVDWLRTTRRGVSPMIAAACDSSNTNTYNETVCRELYIDETLDVCGNVDLTLTDFRYHPYSGGHLFMKGLAQLGGAPNHFEVLFDSPTINGDVMRDWGTDSIQDFWFWFIYLGIGIAYTIGLIAWSGALCCRCCRRCYGRCFKCCQCCHERWRIRPIWRTRKKRKNCLCGWYIAFPFLWSFVFIILGVVYGVYAGLSSERVECTLWRSSAAMLFGDSEWQIVPQFPGTVFLDDTMSRSANEITVLSDDARLIMLEIDAGNQTAETYIHLQDSTVIFEQFDEMIEGTEVELTSMTYNFDNLDRNTGTQTASSYHRLLIFDRTQADLYQDHVVNEVDYSARYSQICNDLHLHLTNYTLGLEPVVDYLPEAPRDLNLIAFNNRMYEVMTNVRNESWIFSDISLGVWIGFLLIPGLSFLLWIASLALFLRLGNRYYTKNDPNVKQMRNWFACMCFFLGLFSCVAYLLGVIVLLSSQPGAELYYFFDEKLFINGNYWDYTFIQNNFAGQYSTFTAACGTYIGEPSMAEALSIDMDDLENWRFMGTEMTRISDEALLNATTTFTEISDSFNETYVQDIQEGVSLVILDPEELATGEDQTRLAVFKEFLYGHIGDQDVPIVGDYLTGIAEDIRLTAYTNVEDQAVRFDYDGTTDIPKQKLLNEMYGPTHFYGMPSQQNRLQASARLLGFATDFCNEYNDPTNYACCQGSNSCIFVNGDRISQISTSSAGVFQLLATMQAAANEPSDTVANPGGLIPGDSQEALRMWPEIEQQIAFETSKLEEAVMFVNSMWLFMLRERIRREDPNGSGNPTEDVFYAYELIPFQPVVGDLTNAVTYVAWAEQVERFWREFTLNRNVTEKYEDVLTDLQVLDRQANDLWASQEAEYDCQYAFRQVAGAFQFAFDVANADVAMCGLWWVMMALGFFVGAILAFRMFHYFADRQAELDDDERRRKDYRRPSKLLYHCMRGETYEVSKCCKYQNPNSAADPTMNGCLHLTAYYNHPDTTEYLLTQKCNPNVKNNSGYTPVEVASAAGHPEIVKLLVSSGGNTRTLDPFGETPVHETARDGDHATLRALLYGEAKRDRTRMPRDGDGQTPKAVAEHARRTDVAKALDQFYNEKDPESKARFLDEMEKPADEISLQSFEG